VPFVRGNVVHRPPLSESGSSAITAIIDAGIDILHECFRDAAGLTRFEAVWDQRDNSGPSPAARGAPAGLNYGTMHTRADIASHLAAGTAPGGLGRDLNGHGTHVTSIAAGRAVGSFPGGMAPDARIVFVRPKLSVSPGDRHSIGYSLSHVDALSLINHMATKLNLPVVVNVSLGMNAGAHDGSSLLEAAFDQFSEGGRKPGRVIIKSAGNERGRNGHAKLTLGSEGLDLFKWKSQSAHVGPDNLEIWFHPADDLRFRLKAPNGEMTSWIERNAPGEPCRGCTRSCRCLD
jgi:subtilisin family serine protease